MLGASPARVRREIVLPLVLRAFGVAAGFAFAISLGEFGATVFVARADWPTVPVAIFAFLGRPGAVNQGIAASLAVVLMVVTALAAFASDRIGGARERCERSGRGRRDARRADARRRYRAARGERRRFSGPSGSGRARSCGRSPGSSGRSPGACSLLGATSPASRRTAAASA